MSVSVSASLLFSSLLFSALCCMICPVSLPSRTGLQQGDGSGLVVTLGSSDGLRSMFLHCESVQSMLYRTIVTVIRLLPRHFTVLRKLAWWASWLFTQCVCGLPLTWHLVVCLSSCVSVCLSVCLCVCLSVCMSVCPSVVLSCLAAVALFPARVYLHQLVFTFTTRDSSNSLCGLSRDWLQDTLTPLWRSVPQWMFPWLRRVYSKWRHDVSGWI